MITVYIDHGCPFAWRGVELAAVLADASGLEFELRHYSLEQGNHPENVGRPRGRPAWKLAEQVQPDPKSRLPVFLASQAARLQGRDAHLRFTLELFRLRFLEKRDLLDPEAVPGAARRAGLDLGRLERDLTDGPARLAELAADLDAADELAVFGTPTFVLESGHAAYFRFAELPATPDAAAALWSLYTSVLESGARIETIKRPRKP